MWLVVYYPDSNDYCVLKSSQVTEGDVSVGSFVKVVYNAKVLFTNSSKAVCDKECDNILKKLPSPEETHCETQQPPPNPTNNPLYSSKLDAILSCVSRIDSGLRELSCRQQEVQQNVDLIRAKVERLEQSERSLRASVYELLDRVPPPSDISKALTYPYNLTKEGVDDIYLMKRSPTAFARAVERELFIREADKNANLDTASLRIRFVGSVS
ncbi:hypothetical protein ANCCAN_05626 [Ancylostoma caninum]|uniref:Uncharacterized protein n=1 Tax=Ancylostoma caninum TaxID=29170 RepID=A0A368GZA2_ANCCA|nr:hypothetical protein ANCCAN_05626 [Ancylostoma caninum]